MTEHELRTVTGPDTLDRIHSALDAALATAPISDTAQMSIELAVSEIGTNIIEHARSGRPVNLRMLVVTNPESVSVTFTDDGDPCAVDVTGVGMPDALSERHRGLAIAQTVLDELSYRRDAAGNHWTLVRRRSA